MPVKKSPREPIPGQLVLAGSLVTPGGEQGIPGPSAVSKDEGNIATIGSDGFIYVPASGGGGGGGVEYDLGHYAPLDAVSTTTDQTLAVYFNVSSPAKLKSVSFYKTANEAAIVNHSFQIWDTAGVPLWNHPPDADTAVEGWITHQLLVPILLGVGKTYILGIHASNGYVNNTGHIPLTDGPLSATASSRLTGNGPPIIPDSTPMHYGLDLVIEVEEGGGGETETEYTLGHVAPQFSWAGAGYTFGIIFSVSVDGYLKEVSWYKTIDEASTLNHSFIIWDEAQVPIWNGPPDNEQPVEGWITHRFAIPMPLSAGTYRLGLYATNGYGGTDVYYPHVDGPLSSESGCYIMGNGYPASSSVNFYSFDLVFAVSAGGGGGVEEAPIDGKQYARQDASWTEVISSGGIGYSTEEQDTGLTWIDGEKIYRKVFDLGTLANDIGVEHSIAHGITLGNVVTIRGIAKNGTYFLPIPFLPDIQLWSDLTNITYALAGTAGTYVAYTVKVIFEYTKGLPLPPVLTSVVPSMGYGSPMTVQANGSNFTNKCKGVHDSYGTYYDIPTTFVSSTQLTLQVSNQAMSVYYFFIEDEYGQRSQILEIAGGPSLAS